ncbi:single-stranded DNA-binding protein 2 [Spirochaetia bacterium]|nr:single-stranded DNA-binding protein 2 [Spirochaetia bacterium]
MNNLNTILVEGNLTRDPEYKVTAKGTPLCTFAIASNRYIKQDDGMEKEVSYFDVATWSKLAENVRNLGHKGRGVRVVGRLKQERWNGSDGMAHSKVSIIAEHVEFRPETQPIGKDEGSKSESETLPEESSEDEELAVNW